MAGDPRLSATAPVVTAASGRCAGSGDLAGDFAAAAAGDALTAGVGPRDATAIAPTIGLMASVATCTSRCASTSMGEAPDSCASEHHKYHQQRFGGKHRLQAALLPLSNLCNLQQCIAWQLRNPALDDIASAFLRLYSALAADRHCKARLPHDGWRGVVRCDLHAWHIRLRGCCTRRR